MEPCVLAIDLGASSGRVIAAQTDGKTLRCHEIHRFANEPVACCGSLYWDVLNLFNQIKKGIALAAQRYTVKSLAIDTWGVDFGLLDESGRLIENPICYRDERTRGILKTLSETISMQELFAQTGNTPDEINTLMQLAALKNQRPEVLERAHQLLFMPDLIGYFLTGKQACEFTIASTSQCLNPERTGIHTELLERLGLQPDLFAPLRYPGEILGTLKPEIAAECGCGEIDVLLCGAHDTASAIYGGKPSDILKLRDLGDHGSDSRSAGDYRSQRPAGCFQRRQSRRQNPAGAQPDRAVDHPAMQGRAAASGNGADLR